MLSIGLTGGIGSGKTFVADILKTNSQIRAFDSDLIAKQILNDDQSVKKNIISNFGDKSYINNKINTKFISDIVFSNQVELKKLNNIVHPRVLDFFKIFKLEHSNKIIVLESALLFETGLYLYNDINILITSSLEVRINRVMKRDKSSKEDVLRIIKSQWQDSKKIEFADFVIENINKLETEKKVKKLINSIISSYEEN